MAMPMVQVGIMGMAVDHRRMAMPVAMRLTRRSIQRVIMLMMGVMDVAVLMLKQLV
jgi:hypothetical protein